MRLSVGLCAAVVGVVGVVVAAVDQTGVHNDPRRVASPLVPEERLNYVRNRGLSSEARGRQWTRPNRYSSHYRQEDPDASGTYWANQRLRGRHRSPGGRAETRNLHTEDMAAARHESTSRTLQPVRINTDSVHAPSPASRPTTPDDDRFSSHVHQAVLYTSPHERRRLPHLRGSHETRVPSSSRDRLQRPPPERRVETHNRVSHDNAWTAHTPSAIERGHQVYSGSMAASTRPSEIPTHHRYRVPDTRSGLASTTDPSTAAISTRGRPREQDAALQRPRTQHGVAEISEEVNNDVWQRLDQHEPCCGSRVPLDPRTTRVTGAFERVASAGSIKVLEVPANNNYPPSEVRDLHAAPLDFNTISLTWTAPGEDLDAGTVSGYVIRLSEAPHDLQELHFDAAPENTLLQATEALTVAGVFQPSGTRVGAAVAVVQQLQIGHVYYVALKAYDSAGSYSGVSNLARFTIPGHTTEVNTAASHDTASTQHAREDPRLEEGPGASNTRGSVHRDEERAVLLSERNPIPPATRGSSTASEAEAEVSSRRVNNEKQSLLPTSPTPIPVPSEPETSENQPKRGGRKDRKKKKNKKSKKRKGRRRNGRRDDRRRGGSSGTSVLNSHALDIYAEIERWNES